MTWRVFATATANPDFAALNEAERAVLNEDLFGWVDHGPGPERGGPARRPGAPINR